MQINDPAQNNWLTSCPLLENSNGGLQVAMNIRYRLPPVILSKIFGNIASRHLYRFAGIIALFNCIIGKGHDKSKFIGCNKSAFL